VLQKICNLNSPLDGWNQQWQLSNPWWCYKSLVNLIQATWSLLDAHRTSKAVTRITGKHYHFESTLAKCRVKQFLQGLHTAENGASRILVQQRIASQSCNYIASKLQPYFSPHICYFYSILHALFIFWHESFNSILEPPQQFPSNQWKMMECCRVLVRKENYMPLTKIYFTGS
jgi:hypothetical protein